MKFVGNFIIFGLIFYLIWQYQPDVFNFLVSMAERLIAFTTGFVMQVIRGVDPDDEAIQALLRLFYVT